MTDTRPLLLIDVDGPLNPHAANPNKRPHGYVTHRMRPTGWDSPHRKPLRVWLNRTHGPALMALPYQLVWATAWEAEANEWIGPHLGLPELPHIDWPQPGERIADPSIPAGLHWKTLRVVEYAAGRPFAWIDDEISLRDTDYIAANHDGPALLHRVSPRLGLLQDDFDTLAAWAATLPDQEPTGRTSA
ncbi:hypothetical protein ACFQ6Q_00615 [Streptomyces sp. NPDC056437]|uniref:hypothetical protein n=1 Tax=Streptomyces sp. NPDC056437 TaxID=3345816 RepID=UPI0036B847C0